MVVVYVDEREKNSKVPQILLGKGVTVIFKFLSVGDYVISNSIGIERKTASDFIKSLVDGRLFDQATRLVNEFEKAIMIIEGSLKEAARLSNVRRSAIIGAYITLALDIGIIMLSSRDEEETAEIIKRVAVRERRSRNTMVNIKKPTQKSLSSDTTEWQLYILQAFPHVGPKTAVRILERFGSIYNFCTASLSDLTKIEGLSEKRAAEIYQVIHALYKGFKDQKKEQGKSIIDYFSEGKTG
ncbi:MAG: ERCC4 domain-containing protein [Ignisphaera sp.]